MAVSPAPRRTRRDAELNRERVLAAAVSAMLREGRNVPLATIVAEAGVGDGTLCRSYPDREALLHGLEYRAYGFVNGLAASGPHDIPGPAVTSQEIETSFARRAAPDLRALPAQRVR